MKKILLLFNFIFLGLSVNAQIAFHVIPQKKELWVNETISLQFILSIKNTNLKELGELKLPALNNLQIVSRQVTEGNNINNDDFSIEYRYTLNLRAIKPGTFKIGEATISVNGKKYSTKPLTLTAKNNPNEQEEKTSIYKNSDSFLSLKLSNKNPYQNEGIIAQIKFYTQRPGLLNGISRFETPSFQGFSVIPVKENNNNYEQEIINGEVFLSRTIVTYILFPSKPGPITINPFTLTVNAPDGFFDDQEIGFKSSTTTILTKKLPTPPEGFYGLVGNYNIKISPNKKNISEKKPVTVTVEISGKGNMGILKVPEIIAPKELEIFPPKENIKTQATNTGLIGNAVSSIILLPHKSGTYNISTQPICFFNPETESYEKILPTPFSIYVVGNTNQKSTIKDSITNKKDSFQPDELFTKNEIDNLIPDILENKTHQSFPYYLAISGAILISTFAGLFFIIRKKKKTLKKEIQVNTNKNEFEKQVPYIEENQITSFKSELYKLKNLAESHENKPEFYSLLESILQKAGKQNLNLSANQFISTDEIEEKLSNKFGKEFAEEYKNLLLKSQIERYAQLSGSDSLISVYLSLEKIINTLS